MSYQTNPEVLAAIEWANEWKKAEGGRVKPAAVARTYVKLSRDVSGKANTAKVAALGLISMGLTPTPGDVAWLIRDAAIGFPQQPTFDF